MTERLQDVKPTLAGGSNPSCCYASRREEHTAYHLLHPQWLVQPDEAAKRRTVARMLLANVSGTRVEHASTQLAWGRPVATATGKAKPLASAAVTRRQGETPSSLRVKPQPPAPWGLNGGRLHQQAAQAKCWTRDPNHKI